MPCSGSSSATRRYPNSGAPWWISSAALIRCASSQSRSVTGLLLPAVEALSGEAEHPADQRDGDAVSGQFKDQRVPHFGEMSLAK